MEVVKKELRLTESQAKLFEFVKEQHGGQQRKYTGDPYFFHLASVAIIIQESFVKTFLMIEVALCHDLFEDTDCDYEKLNQALIEFGYNGSEAGLIIRDVSGLTDIYTAKDFPWFNRSQRKAKEVERLKGISASAQNVKYADLIDNTSSIVQSDPSFARIYVREKREILNALRKGDLDLYFKAYSSLLEAEAQLKQYEED